MKKFATLLAAGCLSWCFGAGEIPTANNSAQERSPQRQMAALASEADGGLKASGRILSGMIKVPNPNAPKQMLDDVEFFVTEITRCAESEKQRKPCSLSTDAKGVLKSFTETDKAQALRSLSTFCK